MVTIKSNIGMAIKKLQRAKTEIRQRQIDFFPKHRDRYRTEARVVMKAVVYDGYSPKKYLRAGMGGGLLGAVDVATPGDGAAIFVDQEKTAIASKPRRAGEGADWQRVRQFEMQDGVKSYAEHVIKGTGIFSKEFVEKHRSWLNDPKAATAIVWLGKRDFVEKWYNHFGQTIPSEYFEEVVRDGLRKAGFKE